MQFARRFWMAAVCTLALVSASAVQAQPTKLLPNDTEMVVVFNLKQILASDILKGDDGKLIVKLLETKINEGLADKGLDKHLKTAGFEPFRDLSSVTFAMPGGRPPEEGFIVLEGKFDADKIEAAATAAAKDTPGLFKVTKIAGVKTFELAPQNEKTMFVGILDGKTMIICANRNDYTEAVARFNGTKKAVFKAEEFKSLVGMVTAKQSISFVATSKVLTKLAENAPQVEQVKGLLGQADGVSATVTLQKDLDVNLGFYAKDKETASKYAALVSAFIKGAREKAAEKKDDEKAKLALDVLKTIEATAKGPNLTIRAQVSFENLGMILKNIPIPQ